MLKQTKQKIYCYVDGLRKTERRRFANGLRKLRVNTDKVRGLKDENSALIRLADAAAGFVRDSLEGNKELRKLYDRALRNKILREV